MNNVKPVTKSLLTTKVLNAIKLAAKHFNKAEFLITKSELLSNEFGITEWDLRKLGGLDLIKKSNFQFEHLELGEINKSKKEKSYITKLESALGEKIAYEELLFDHFSMLEMPKLLPKPKLSDKKVQPRHVVVSLNDCHIGLIVEPEEVGYVNKYGWTEASRRIAYLAKQVAEYKIEHRAEVECLHIVINGDMIQGIIHDLTARNSDLLALQQNGAIHILSNFIDYVRKFYKKVQVHATTGNHSDSVHRREGGNRVTTHIYDSYSAPIYYALSAIFQNDSNISFNYSKGLYVDVALPAGRLMVQHGHVLFSKQLGNTGTTVQVKSLSDAINRFNAGEIARGHDPIKMLLFGHTHCMVHFMTFEGIQVYVAPSLSGIDNFSASLAINHNTVGQVIFESTENYIFGDSRLVNVLPADNDKTLDKIIPIYNRGLAWQK